MYIVVVIFGCSPMCSCLFDFENRMFMMFITFLPRGAKWKMFCGEGPLIIWFLLTDSAPLYVKYSNVFPLPKGPEGAKGLLKLATLRPPQTSTFPHQQGFHQVALRESNG